MNTNKIRKAAYAAFFGPKMSFSISGFKSVDKVSVQDILKLNDLDQKNYCDALFELNAEWYKKSCESNFRLLEKLLITHYKLMDKKWLLQLFLSIDLKKFTPTFEVFFVDLVADEYFNINDEYIEKSKKLLIRILNKGSAHKDITGHVKSVIIAISKKKTDDDFFSDELVVASLQCMVIHDTEFEKRMYAYRTKLLKRVTEAKQCSSQDEAVIYSFAIQQYHKEYCIYINNAETEFLKELQTHIENLNLSDSNVAGGIALYLLLFSMYEPLDVISNIYQINRDCLPSSLELLLKKTFDIKAYLKSLANGITSSTELTKGASEIVRSQYEENPYPRWDSINIFPYLSLTSFFRGQCNGRDAVVDIVNCENINKVLVAGCGTGRHPISIAQALPFVKIDAIDLSKSSLAYAFNKAQSLTVTNVSFSQADILNISQLNTEYDFIDCSGVLHHMEDPLDGLKALVSILADDGIMRLALYSRTARKEVEKIRNQLTMKSGSSSVDSLRLIRAEIMQKGASEVLLSKDFYTYSECRDLLFHTHEITYDWYEIKQLLEAADLELVSIVAPKRAEQEYLRIYPDDISCKSIKNWAAFEDKYPATFWGMYNFWVKKKN